MSDLRFDTGGISCLTCRNHPEVAEAINGALQVWLSNGERTGSFASLHRSVSRVFPEYKLSEAAMMKHMRKCLKDVFDECKALPCRGKQ